MKREVEKAFVKRIEKRIKEGKKIPGKVYFVRDKKKVKVCFDLVEVSSFFGIKPNTARMYSCYKKHNLGNNRFMIPYDAKTLIKQIESIL